MPVIVEPEVFDPGFAQGVDDGAGYHISRDRSAVVPCENQAVHVGHDPTGTPFAFDLVQHFTGTLGQR